MTTVDQLLSRFVKNNLEQLKSSMSYRDVRILSSLHKSATGATFITANQGRLLIKIFTENKSVLMPIAEDLDEIITTPTWSQPFRPADTTRKLYTTKNSDGSMLLTVEFAFSSEIRKKINALSKSTSGMHQGQNGKCFFFDYTEKNIEQLVDALATHDFDIEENIQDYHKIIKSWNEQTIRDQFLISNISHDTFQRKIIEDLGKDTSIDKNIINDRSTRYQYVSEKSEKNPENLTELIANRKTSKVWVDKKVNTLENIFDSLVELKRFPVLVVFDTYASKTSTAELTKISEILEKYNIRDNVGIYFRMNNDEIGKEFNQVISDKKYNAQLTKDTKLVGVQSGKIPKFLLKSDWKPMSVVSIDTTLRHSKTAVYANCCDLIISFTESESIYEPKIAWE